MLDYYPQLLPFLEEELSHDTSGHSLDHALRVYKNAKLILSKEGGNERLILISALVHDVIDPKLFSNIEEQKLKLQTFLEEIDCPTSEITEIFSIIENISYKGGHGKKLSTLEAQIVQDADRLDAIGAIGIGRTFMYGGARGSIMHDDTQKPQEFENEATYRKHQGTVINHFYEKLFKLKDLMNTETAKEIALKRHEFMVTFVQEFLNEWNGLT